MFKFMKTWSKNNRGAMRMKAEVSQHKYNLISICPFFVIKQSVDRQARSVGVAVEALDHNKSFVHIAPEWRISIRLRSGPSKFYRTVSLFGIKPTGPSRLLPALVGLPCSATVSRVRRAARVRQGRRRRRRCRFRTAVVDEDRGRGRQFAVVVGALDRVGKGGVGGMDPHELVRGGTPAAGGDHVRMALERQAAVRGLDLLAASAGGDAEGIVKGGGGG
ncbi:unnamed protein product, partial [Musa hybrid cultivar]